MRPHLTLREGLARNFSDKPLVGVVLNGITRRSVDSYSRYYYGTLNSKKHKETREPA